MEDGMINQSILAVKKCFIINSNIPEINRNKGVSLWWCFLYPCQSVKPPIRRAMRIIPASKYILSRMLMPNKGNVLIKSGNKAQWIAQASPADTPSAFQLIWIFIGCKDKPVQPCCKIYYLCLLKKIGSIMSNFGFILWARKLFFTLFFSLCWW